MSEFSQDWFKAALWVTWVLADNLIDRPEPVAELSDGIRKLCELDFPSRTLLATGAKCGYCPRRRRIWIKPEHLTSETSLDPILLTRINPRRKTPSFRTRIKRLCLDHTVVDKWRFKTLGQVLDEWNETDDTLKRIKTGLNRLQSAHLLDLRFPGVLVLGRQRTSGKQEGCLSLGFRFEREIARLESLAEGFRFLEQPEPLAGFESAEGRVPRLLSQPMDAEVPIGSPSYKEQTPPKRTSETKEVALQQFMAQKRQFVREACSFRFRRQLCLPLRDADIVELLPSKDLRSEEIPKPFAYVPHTLTYATVPPGQTAESVSFDEVDFEENVVPFIADTKERLVLLVEAKAGYGKTTFMYRLAYALAKYEGGALPLPPVRVVERSRSESPVNWSELVTRGVRDLERLSGDEIRREDVESMMNDGHAVAFVDGLDQLPDGAAKLLVGLPPATKPIKVVASCRQEAHAVADHGWTHVLRLGSPSKEDFSQNVPKEHQDLLEACLGDDDPRNPFMLHIVRVMDCAEGPLPAVAGITELFDSYLAFLFAWAEAKRTGEEVKDRPEDLTCEQRLALGLLGLTSLRYRPRGGATEQRIDKEVFDTARDVARQLAMDANWSSQAVDQVFDQSRDHADLVYIAREAFLRKQKSYLFHHQLLQEYLGAVGTIDELERQLDGATDGDRAVTTMACLARLFSDVIVPRRSDGVKPSVPPEVPSHYRISHLRYFEFVARLLGRTESPLSLEDRARFLSLIPAAIQPRDLNDVQYPLVPMVATALLRLRDEMSEHDTSLIGWAQEATDHDTDGRRTKRAKVESGAVRDAFILVCWPEEKHSIKELQPDDEEIAELADRMRRQEPELGWTVTREDHAVVATTNEGTHWLHVPAGEFIAGGWSWMEDMPVRLERTGAFWIAHDPVTFGEFKLFVGKGYNLDDDCWYPFPDWAYVHHEELPLSRFRPVLRDDAPIVWVGWCEAAAYCRWLSLKQSRNRCADRYRLPTGPEWEKAARGLFGRRWPWGNVWRDEMAAVTSRGESTVRPVAVADVSNVSPFGVRGMIGNVFEWTSSCGYTAAVPDITPLSVKDPIHVRGGRWSSGFWNSQCASWQSRLPRHTKWVGFRCVREVR